MKRKIKFKVFAFLFLLKLVWSGHAPHVSAGHRVQYYLIHPASGRYKYGYDTDSNYFAKQHGDHNNQVEGQYAYQDQSSHNIGLKYTAGVQGFVPVSFYYTNLYHKYHPVHQHVAHPGSFHPVMLTYAPQHHHTNNNVVGPHPDGSYRFSYTAGDHATEESSDSSGNVHGSFWYINKDSKQDSSYIARERTGFQPTGGSLATPVHLPAKHTGTTYDPRTGHHTFRYHHLPPHFHTPMFNYAPQYMGGNHLPVGPNTDSSYHFSYSTDEQAREEAADSSGTVRGNYWYINKDGKYDLSYIAGDATGFQPTGGNLATPVHLPGRHIGTVPAHATVPHSVSHHHQHLHTPDGEDDTPTTDHPTEDESSSGDASYSFKIDTDEYQREETSDSEGNIQGKYSYQNKDGQFDLEYQAGSDTGFVATGGNLASPETAPKVARSSHVESVSHTGGGKPQFVSKEAKIAPLTLGNVPIIPGNDLPVQAVKFPSHQHSAINGIVLKSFLPLAWNKEKYGYVFESKH